MTVQDGATRETILDAAAELFGERGYRGSTTRAIAERAGVNEVTLFRRFGSKQGILRALVGLWTERMAGFAVANTPDPSDTRGTLEALARLEVRQAMESGAVAMRLAMDSRSSPEVAEVLGGGPTRNLAGLVAYLAERQSAGDLRPDLEPRVMAEAFFALTSQWVMSRQALGDIAEYELSVEAASGPLFELFMSGIERRSGT